MGSTLARVRRVMVGGRAIRQDRFSGLYVFISSLLVLLLLVLVPLSQVAAQSDEQRALFDNEVLYFDHAEGASPCVSGGDLDQFLQALSDLETGGSGNPTAKNPRSSAAGKYQYLTGTWRARYDIYPPASNYPTADKAPEEIQDAVAYIEYAQKWEEFNGDIFTLALSHFYPAAIGNPGIWDTKVGSNAITIRQYADGMVRRVNEGAGNHIPLRYSEAPEFEQLLGEAVGDSFSPVPGVATCLGGRGVWSWPHGGESAEVTSCFGSRAAPTAGASTNHQGVDISSGAGSPVLAADGGVVTFAGELGQAGLMVKIDHGGGSETQYMHNSEVHVSIGDQVSAGQHIADEGSTGNVTGAHLHFEIVSNGTKINPLNEIVIPDDINVTGSNCTTANTGGQL